jgi:hypothetical protein
MSGRLANFISSLNLVSKVMFSSLDFVMVVIGIGAVCYLYSLLPQRGKMGLLAATLLTVTLSAIASPAYAAAANENVLSDSQKALQENLKTTPHDNQYQGIEYAQEIGELLSDRAITERVKAEIPSNLKLSVSNGSVRLSGKVSDLDTAKHIVQDIKAVPGVHEISYDLGLNS